MDGSPEQEESAETKRCTKCKKTKSLTEFHKDRGRKDGLKGQCKACRCAYGKSHYQANRERIRERHAEYMPKYYTANRERIAEQKREYARNNLDKKRARDQRRRARKVNAEGSFTEDEWVFTLRVLDYRCIYCNIHKDDTPEKWLEADHLTPLSRGGTNYIDNIVPACKSCNCSKGAKTFDEFIEYLQKHGKL